MFLKDGIVMKLLCILKYIYNDIVNINKSGEYSEEFNNFDINI